MTVGEFVGHLISTFSQIATVHNNSTSMVEKRWRILPWHVFLSCRGRRVQQSTSHYLQSHWILTDPCSGERGAFDFAKAHWPTHFGDNLSTSQAILEALVGLPDTT